MVADTGLAALILAFLFCLYSVMASAWGGFRQRPVLVESARNAALVVFSLLSISVRSVLYSLYVMDFSQAYVYDVASRAMNDFLRLTALWGGQNGSVLFWTWIMAGFVVLVLLRKWERDRELMPYVILVALLTTGFFGGVWV